MKPNDLQIFWNTTEREHWDAEHGMLGAALQQAWAYGESLRTPKVGVQRAEVRLGGRAVALAQFICRRYGGLFGVALCTRGPLWTAAVDADTQVRIYRELKRTLPLPRPRIALFSPDLDDPQHPGLSGLTRVLTGYSTVIVDIGQPEGELRSGLHPYWRNRLGAAERSGLTVSESGLRPQDTRRVLDEEMAQRRRKGFYALPVAFVDNYIAAHADPQDAALILQASLGKEVVAAMLFLRHGSSATYQLGWSMPAGRAAQAHNLLLWHAFARLRERGVTKLDLGGVNTRDQPGISRFKLSTGGRVITYAGGYV